MSVALNTVSNKEQELLCKTLWSWEYCDICETALSERCNSRRCPSLRYKRLFSYLDVYKETCRSFEANLRNGDLNTINTHEQLRQIIRLVRASPHLTRQQIVESVEPRAIVAEKCVESHVDRALDVAVKVMLMIGRSGNRLEDASLLERGLLQTQWRSNETLVSFIGNSFPTTDHPDLNVDKQSRLGSMRKQLQATELMRYANLSFVPTEDLRRHLRLDRKSGNVEIFHHTAFLKEHLRLTQDQPSDVSTETSLARGALPRQLVLETLYSVQEILFPLNDEKSKALLRSLVSKERFDPDCIDYESASFRSKSEGNIGYYYWGARLADLYEELENPTPRSWVEIWLERKSGARYVMLATLIGVVFAVLLGIASLAVGGYQAWVSYQAWKHPVNL